MPRPSRRRLAAAYFYVQAAAGLVWWIWLLLDPAAFALFWPSGTPRAASLAFLLPDFALFCGASIVTARLATAASPKAERWGWLTIGAVAYAALYCIALVFLDADTWRAAPPMTCALIGTLWAVRAVAE